MTIELEEPLLEHDKTQVLKDLFGGTVGGVAQVLVGQPFDTVKVRLQSAPEGTYKGALDVMKQLVTNEGIKGFYKGTLTPLIGVGACVSIQFSVNEYMKRYFDEQNKGQPLSLSQFFCCGAFAGFAIGGLASPIELIRIKLQTQTGSTKTFSGPLDCFFKIYQNNGVNGIFKGLVPTLVRESIGLGIYFTTYEALINREKALNNISRREISNTKLCLYGGLSGYTLWSAIYPMDIIKSKLQADSLSSPKYKGIMAVARDTFITSGIKGFYKGFIPTILRAAPANGATFAAFEMTMRLID